MSFEVEQKFPISDRQALERALREAGAILAGEHAQSDTYYNHPARDFGETREALRIRRCDGVPSVTYKGPKLPGTVKARRELEWRLDPGDEDGSKMEALLTSLGFRPVATVRKRRLEFTHRDSAGELLVTIDRVEGVGDFAEIEIVVAGPEEVDSARTRILRLADSLGLPEAEPRSYLRMLLEGERCNRLDQET